MSDPPDKSNADKPRSSRSNPELQSSDADFWDLDEEVEAPAPPSRTPEPAPTPAPTEPGPTPVDPAGGEARTEEPPAPAMEDGDESSDDHDGQGFALNLSKAEKTAVLGVGACILLAAIWALTLFFSSIRTDTPDADLDYPISGKVITIESATTYWRKPNPETDRGIRPTAKLVPVANIKLESGQSGALRLLFRDDADDIIGDPITLTITDGRLADGSQEIRVYATDGFSDEGDHAAYVTEQITKWYVEVKEGPDANAPGDAFKELCRIPISKTRK